MSAIARLTGKSCGGILQMETNASTVCDVNRHPKPNGVPATESRRLPPSSHTIAPFSLFPVLKATPTDVMLYCAVHRWSWFGRHYKYRVHRGAPPSKIYEESCAEVLDGISSPNFTIQTLHPVPQTSHSSAQARQLAD